jgi:DNA-binding CsgD family transcriptional regulator
VAVDELVASGQKALSDGRWDAARTAFETALASGESPEALDGLAEVSQRDGDYAAAIELREGACAAFLARGDTGGAARVAAYHLAFDYAAVYGSFAVANGWLERGKRLADQAGDCVERGWVELACVLTTSDPAVRDAHITAALDIADRHVDTNLHFDATAYAGVALVERGDIAEGMSKIDEASVAVRSGEVRSATASGEILCKMLLACELVLDVRRAEQWMALAKKQPLAWPSAICRMHYGGILTAAGHWDEAEDELGTSERCYDASYPALRSGAAARLAELRVRQGRLPEADELLDGHAHDPFAVRPLAALHLARNESEVAVTLLRRQLAEDPPGVGQVPSLGLLVEADLAAGHPDAARHHATALATIAERSPAPAIHGAAALAAALVSAVDDKAVPAGHLERALAGFAAAGLPLEEARTRLALARILADRRDLASAEATSALTVFERLGARRDADAAAALLRSLGVRGRTGPKHVDVLSRREQEVLALLGLGLSNGEIATRLYISPKTASHHVSSVLAKLGLRNRAEAAAYAVSIRRAQRRGGASVP